MKRALLAHLCSPLDRSPLNLEADTLEGDHIIEGRLVDSSGNVFPIEGGIPYFAANDSADESFDFKWSRIGDTYGHENASRTIRQQWYLDRFGFGDRQRLIEYLRDRSTILDCAAGSGVDTDLFSESGGTVVAIDLSRSAVMAMHNKLGTRANVHILQADMRRLPFAPGTFDYISCDQALHHTADTAESFAGLLPFLAPGGELAIYVYRQKAPIREMTDDFVRATTTQMSPEQCYDVCRSITLLGKALSELDTEVTLPEAIPLLGIPSGTHDIQRLLYWNVIKCFWNEAFDFETNVMVNFDWYHPKFAWRHTPEEVRSWFEGHGLEVKHFDVALSGISSRGTLAAG